MYYRKAIELDPDYALAYAGIADLYIIPNNGLSQLEAMPIARKYATQALLLDSTLSEALTTLGFIQSAYDYDWAKAKITLLRAIALNPNYPTAHLFYGNLLQYTGENTEQGINEIRKALILDPLSWNLNYVLGRNFYYAHKYDSALEQLKNTLTLSPGIKLAKANLALVLLALKQYTQAFEVIKQIERSGVSKIFYYQGAVLSYAYAVSGDTARARTELTKSLQEFPNQSPYQLARVYILLNEPDEAITSLEKAYALREVWMYGVNADPTIDPIRNEPRFRALLKRMNLD
jgi:serine/threonine-protein kinase